MPKYLVEISGVVEAANQLRAAESFADELEYAMEATYKVTNQADPKESRLVDLDCELYDERDLLADEED